MMSQLQQRLAIVGIVWAIVGVALPGTAQEKQSAVPQPVGSNALGTVRDRRPATTVQEWMAQVEAATIRVTGVRVEPTGGTVRVILETSAGITQAPTNRSEGNTLVSELNNAVLALPDGNRVAIDKPGAGISAIEVIQATPTSVQVRITGETAVPVVEVVPSAVGLVLSAEADEDVAEEEITVTGEGQGGYRVPNASTATRTDTPIRDIPASIQVVPRQVLEDRNVETVSDAVETVSGVVETSSTFGSSSPIGNSRSIRGFQEDSFSSNLRNGFREQVFPNFSLIGTTEQVEVLKGPASVLFGALEPGGVINLVTRQPLAEPYYRLGLEVGSFGRYQPSIDFSGSLNADKSVLYRFIAAYQSGGYFQDNAQSQTTTIAPSLTFQLGDRTDLNFYYEYGRYYADPIIYQTPILSDGRLPPRDFYANYFPRLNSENHRLGYTLNHELSEDWQIRNNLAINFNTYFLQETYYLNLLNDRFLTGFEIAVNNITTSNYIGQIDLVGKFKTGSVSHQLVAGFDFNRLVFYRGTAFSSSNLPDLDIFSPNYNVPRPDFPSAPFTTLTINQSYGIYLQDQIAFRII
ncbi:TonB-dependent receptor plug domain-containing protein [Phormidesmis sp. 146-35]